MHRTRTPRNFLPLVALASASGLALPALAGGLAEAPVEAPVAAPAPIIETGTDWTGGWVGGHLGYGDAEAGAADGSGVVYGLGGGYDYDFGQWVAGAALEWSKTDLDVGTAGDNLDDITRLKFRVGADLGRTLLYATAGPASANATVGGLNDSDTGWFGGIGADWLVNDRWTVGGEILTNQFDDFAGSGTDLEATTATVNVGLRF